MDEQEAYVPERAVNKSTAPICAERGQQQPVKGLLKRGKTLFPTAFQGEGRWNEPLPTHRRRSKKLTTLTECLYNQKVGF